MAIPALNEANTIRNVILQVRKNFDYDVLVVDDGSIDKTRQIAINAGATVLTHPFNAGVGAAMRSAFSYALRMNYDIVVQIDADGQHPPKEMQGVIELLEFADVGIGSRLLEKTSYKFSPARRIAIGTLSALLRLLIGKKIHDPTSGFRASNKKAIKVFAEHYPSEYLGDTVASILIANRFGLDVAETKVEMLTRQGGIPSQNLIRAAFLLARVVIFLVITKFRKLGTI
ncbi:WcaA Glycosyltransferases involved in cell wall biogenesis [Candidatus Nanopelagicaceae bacterium]